MFGRRHVAALLKHHDFLTRVCSLAQHEFPKPACRHGVLLLMPRMNLRPPLLAQPESVCTELLGPPQAFAD